jgi:hypothetical protein
MADDMNNIASGYHAVQDRDRRADAFRQRQLKDQQAFTRLRSRTDYVVQPGVVGTRDQSLQKAPMGDFQRMTSGEQVVRNPDLLKRAIMPTPISPVPQPRSVSTQPYAPKVQKYPLQHVPSTLYTGGLQTGLPVKKWPTSFKKAFHKPTQDETILKGLHNLDNMSRSLLGGPRR